MSEIEKHLEEFAKGIRWCADTIKAHANEYCTFTSREASVRITIVVEPDSIPHIEILADQWPDMNLEPEPGKEVPC